ncbi:hypothetical protein ACNKHX_07575 [Shigella flexneri]
MNVWIARIPNVYTIKNYGPDRVAGFSPIPAMSMVSYASGARYLSLIGGGRWLLTTGTANSPLASPQTWVQQSTYRESADWYNAPATSSPGAQTCRRRVPRMSSLY